VGFGEVVPAVVEELAAVDSEELEEMEEMEAGEGMVVDELYEN